MVPGSLDSKSDSRPSPSSQFSDSRTRSDESDDSTRSWAFQPRLVHLKTQVAGHAGVLSDENGELIIKPCSETEIEFYEASLKDYPGVVACMPRFLGVLQLNTPETMASMPPQTLSLVTEHLSTHDLPVGMEPPAVLETANPAYSPPQSSWERGVVLDNLAFGYERPCIMDIKLGSRLWDDDATPEKRARLDAVSARTTSGSMGLRIAGMTVWNAKSAEYETFSRQWGKDLTPLTLYMQGIRKFFSANIRPCQMEMMVQRLLERIKTILETFDDLEVRIYSPSLLFVYEGDQTALDLAIEEEGKQLIKKELGNGLARTKEFNRGENKVCDAISESDDDEGEEEEEDYGEEFFCACRMIDFAHAKFVPGLGRDENLLQGLKNVRSLFKHFLDDIASSR